MPALDPASIGLIVVIAASAAFVLGGAGLLLLHLGRRWTLMQQLLIVVGAPIASISAASVAVGSAMFLSLHDLAVTLWITGVAGAVSLVVAAVLGAGLMRAVRDLLESARNVGTGTGPPPGRQRTTELHRLSTELAAASLRLTGARQDLERVDESRRELIAWVSHDLRTPLAGMRAMAEALEDGLVDDPQRYYAGIRSQVDRLSRLVDDLFELSKLFAGAIRPQRTRVSVYDLVSDQIADLAPLSAERQIFIAASGDLDVFLDADPHQLSRALTNVLVNALTHSPPGTQVDVRVRASTDLVEIAVSDMGGGIPPEDLERVFDAGWRGDQARTGTRSSGSGLGLAIVRGILDAHGGTVQADNVPGGSRFVLRLPRTTPVPTPAPSTDS